MSKLQKALAELMEWTPEATPIQFTEKHNPHNQRIVLIGQPELDEDKTAPFFTEAYLYNLLGKEDARGLLGRINRIVELSSGETPDKERA